MLSLRTGLAAVAVLFATSALAQESEFVQKMQEDLDGYKGSVESACGAKAKLAWTGGKFGHNPRESEKPEWNALSTLCTSAVDALQTACSESAPVKKAAGKITKIECKKGKGTIGYSLKGSTAVFTVDPSFTSNNASGQTTDLVAKMKKDLDK